MRRMTPREMRREIHRLKKKLSRVKTARDFADDPVGYAEQILGITSLWDEQKRILQSLLKPPHRSLVKAGHGVGKTYLAAIAVSWWYDSHDPGVVISTAPSHREVCDLLWSEIRIQRQRVGLGGLQPAAPEMRSGPGHYAKGFTARDGTSFAGRHPDKLLVVFDEATGVDPVFWETTSTMWQPRDGHAWLAIFNPTSTTSQAFIEDHSTDQDGKPTWHQFSLDCLDHPNVKGRGRHDPPLIKAAVSWAQVNQWVQQWCEQIPAGEATATDLEWPAGSGSWWKQGPSFLARARGLWPSGGAWTVWSELNWMAALNRPLESPPINLLPEIGCDTARGGEDFSSIHVRWGMESWSHESSNVWKAPDLMAKLKTTAKLWAERASEIKRGTVDPKTIPMKIDDDGFGRAVSQMLQADGWNVIPIGAATKSISGLYPNKRSELWFQVSDRATGGWIGLGRLDKAVQDRLRQQLLAVEYYLNAAGMRVVEEKEVTREKIGRSPDDADALHLSYLEGYDPGTARFLEGNQAPRDPWGKNPQNPGRERRKIFGV